MGGTLGLNREFRYWKFGEFRPLCYSRACARPCEALERGCGQFPAFLDPVSPALAMAPAFQLGGSPPFQLAFEVGVSPDHAGRDEGPSWADDAILNDSEAFPLPTDPAEILGH